MSYIVGPWMYDDDTTERTEEAISMSDKDKSKSIEGLKQVAEQNASARDRAVSALVRATGNSRAIKNNEERNRR